VRAWLVRADGGRSLEDFRSDNFVGIRGGNTTATVEQDLSALGDERISAAVAECGLAGSYTRQLRAFVRGCAGATESWSPVRSG
jgi:2-keto-3-deoxy-galactonokinase